MLDSMHHYIYNDKQMLLKMYWNWNNIEEFEGQFETRDLVNESSHIAHRVALS